MAEAVFGLIGVVTGAVVTGAVNWFQAERARAIAARAAKRLVAQELLASSGAIEVAVKQPDESAIARDFRDSIDRGMLKVDAWANYQGILAEQLSEKDWDAVSRAYIAVTFLVNSYGHDDDDLGGAVADSARSGHVKKGYFAV